ncbi:MerR family transcriptional regulator [Ectobacillus sp. JY-23]|uniref:MerR family transcriptional regulator n=1 Tax=Ectobacillus sp. JY-23 TaxID=2933872 RepID=UPI001FF5CEFB|nr:MerR family transcriptional regulator [Ectobacillus sp. JY-23]UOY92421.1 MerR family transcriptional regulator [Ectobacillus sp. JY-23]
MNNSYTIGEMAKLCGVAPSALRYYDSVGLITPRQDSSNHYRYYTYQDVAKVRIIQNLRELRFSIEDIVDMLGENDVDHQLALMEKKRAEIEEEVKALQTSLQVLTNRIAGIRSAMEQEKSFFSAQMKQLPDRRVLSLRKKSHAANLESYTLYFNELISLAKKYDIVIPSHFMIIHHHIDVNQPWRFIAEAEKDIEVCLPLDHTEKLEAERVIDGGLYMTMLVKGMAGKERFQDIMQFVQVWLTEHGYRAAGPITDVLLTDMSQLQPERLPEQVRAEMQIRLVKQQSNI